MPGCHTPTDGGQRGFYFSRRICIVSAAARLSCLVSCDLLQTPTLLTLNKLIPHVHSSTQRSWLGWRLWFYHFDLCVYLWMCMSFDLAYILKNTRTWVLTNGLISIPKELTVFFFFSSDLHPDDVAFSQLRSLSLMGTSTATTCLPSPGSTVLSQVCDRSATHGAWCSVFACWRALHLSQI